MLVELEVAADDRHVNEEGLSSLSIEKRRIITTAPLRASLLN